MGHATSSVSSLYRFRCGHGVAEKARCGKGNRTMLDKFGQGGSLPQQ